jgi:hypothetical protein
MAGPGDDTYALIYIGRSRIGGLIPDVVIEEVYEDQLAITEHPVEDGANVADHAYLRPKIVDMKVGWADYKSRRVGGSTEKYEALLKLQAVRQPLNVSTGKRVFKNMLIASISVTNDVKTKYVLLATVRLREVRISTAANVNTVGNKTNDPTVSTPSAIGRIALNLISQTDIPIIPGQQTRPPDASEIVLPQQPPI